MAKLIMRVEGFDGQVELMSDRVVIYRKGLFNTIKYGLNAKREIPIGAISEVVFKPPMLLGMGQIEFVRSGRSNDERKDNSNSAVRFRRDKVKHFEMLKEKVFEIVNQMGSQKK